MKITLPRVGIVVFVLSGILFVVLDRLNVVPDEVSGIFTVLSGVGAVTCGLIEAFSKAGTSSALANGESSNRDRAQTTRKH